MSEWIVHGRREIYRSDWVRLGLADIEQPDGTRFEHHTVWMPPAAMIALLDHAGTAVLLLWRHRFVTNVWNWELPGGVIEPGEDPSQAAVREAEEETGYRPGRVEHVATFEPMIGMAECPHYVYVGHDTTYVTEPTEQNELDHTTWMPLADIPEVLRSGQVRNSGTMVALLHVLAFTASNSATAR